MGRYKAYPEYKDSGVRRLGKVPIYWGTIKLKRLASIENGHDYKYVEAESGYPVIGSGGQFAWAKSYIYNEESVLLGRKGTINKPLYISAPFWVVDTMFYTKVVTNIRAKYIYYAALTIEFDLYSTNTALPSMTQEDLGNIYFAKPSIDEASKIEAFLDYETAKIDQLIAKQQRLIELLKEKRQAVISHAVTKGLNPDVKMKDSGVEWLGEVPEYWDLLRLKFIVSLITKKSSRKSHPVGLENIESWTGKFIETESEFQGDGTEFLSEDILFGKLRPYLAKVYVAEKEGQAIGDFHVLRPKKGQGKYFQYLMLTKDFITNADSSTYGAKMPRVSWEFLSNTICAVPYEKEQNEIVIFLDKQISLIESAIEKIRYSITFLQERRSTLISAAVTGKIDVRDWQAPKEAA